jgi:transglutaminase elicitor
MHPRLVGHLPRLGAHAITGPPARKPVTRRPPDGSTITFQYVLEGDASGKVGGGEWVGDSATAHPDFVRRERRAAVN